MSVAKDKGQRYKSTQLYVCVNNMSICDMTQVVNNYKFNYTSNDSNYTQNYNDKEYEYYYKYTYYYKYNKYNKYYYDN